MAAEQSVVVAASRAGVPVLECASFPTRLRVAVLFSFALSSAAVAAEPKTLPTIRVEGAAEPAALYNPQTSRGATRTETPLIETPQSISVITAAQILDQNAQNMQEALRYSAGVRSEMYGVDNRGDWFTLRGGSEGSTLLDGLRLPLSGWYGNVRNEPYAFERIEVLRGPSSVMAGQNGPGGVVNLVSRRPLADAQRELSLQIGNYDHRQIALDLTGPLSESGNVLYRVVGLVKRAGTQVDHADEERDFIAPSITWAPDDVSALTLHAEYQRDESDNNVGFFPWEGMLLPAPNGRIPVDTFIGEPDWDVYAGRRTRIGYRYTRELDKVWTLRHSLRYDDVSGRLRGMYANFWEREEGDPDGPFLDGRMLNRTWYASRTDTRIANAEVQMDGRLMLGGLEHTILLAADGVWVRDVNSSVEGAATPLDVYDPVYGTFPLPELDFGPDVPTRARQIGLTIQDQVKLDDRWAVTASLRRDEARSSVEGAPESGADDGEWTSRFGVVYLADGGWAPYISYSESFELVAGADVLGAPFKPKRGQQVEAGVKWSPDRAGFMASAAAYRLKEKNRLTTDPTNPNLQMQHGEVTITGAELDAVANFAAVDLIANYTWTDATVSASSDPADPYLHKRLTSIPENAASLWAVYRFNGFGPGELRAGAGVRYIDRTWDGVDVLATPSSMLIDAMVSFDSGRWRYALNASNLTDKIHFATCLDRGDCWYGARREIAASATYRF